MLLRFVSAAFDEDAQVRRGIFQAAYELLDSRLLPWYEDNFQLVAEPFIDLKLKERR